MPSPTVAEPFESAYPRLAAIATARAQRILGSRHDAEEIAQEAVLKAHASWEAVSSYADAWVSRVSTNLALSRLRRRAPIATTPAPAVDAAAPAAQRVDLLRALESLPARQREAVVLRHVLDLNERDTAAAMGCSPGAVKRHLHRALATLRDAPALAAIREQILDRQGGRLMYVWQDHWTKAVEPPAGWPPRPWDHRNLPAADGRRFDRIAVDGTGAPIVDADGDEVLTGPGFDHEPVKHVFLDPVEITTPDIPWEGLDDDVRDAVRRAHQWADWHGHTWVGDEHVLLALLEADPAVVAPFDATGRIDLPAANRAVADFYEGPFAARRVEIVDERRAASWAPVRQDGEEPPALNHAASQLLADLASAAIAAGRLRAPTDVLRAMTEREWDLLTRRMLGRSGNGASAGE